MPKDPLIDPALGLDLIATRTLSRQAASVAVIVPAHNEEATIEEVVEQAHRGLSILDVDGEVIVCASACTDQTASKAAKAGATVVLTGAGKGVAISAGLERTTGDIICLIDGDLQYFGEPPLSALLVAPILNGLADACISDLYWRPLYPQLWLYGFFAPVAGLLFPELLPKVGSTPWSGQRAAVRSLWPSKLPDDFTVDLALLLHWNAHARRLRPVLADDWINPQRPKPDLMRKELDVLIAAAIKDHRLSEDDVPHLNTWYTQVHTAMAEYSPDHDDPHTFEQQILRQARELLPSLSHPVRS